MFACYLLATSIGVAVALVSTHMPPEYETYRIPVLILLACIWFVGGHLARRYDTIVKERRRG